MALHRLDPMGLRHIAGLEQNEAIAAGPGGAIAPGAVLVGTQIAGTSRVGRPLDLGRARRVDDDRMAEKALGDRRNQHRKRRGKRLLGEYFRDHFHITTSGNFSDPAFRCALEIMGADRLYFSADYPFEAMEDGACWFDATTVINEEERLRIGRTNAIELFGLELDTASPAMAASR